MKPGVIAGIIVGALVAIGAVVFVVTGNDETATVAETSTREQARQDATLAAPAVTEADQPVKLEEVAARNTADDCWTIVDGVVYDITTYLPRHPGGSVIAQACGTDGSSLFNNRTTNDGETVGTGSPHSGGAANQLASFRVGILDTTQE